MPPFLAGGTTRRSRRAWCSRLEPKFVFPGLGAIGVENSYAVTADGAQKLTSAPEELVEL